MNLISTKAIQLTYGYELRQEAHKAEELEYLKKQVAAAEAHLATHRRNIAELREDLNVMAFPIELEHKKWVESRNLGADSKNGCAMEAQGRVLDVIYGRHPVQAGKI
jgi:flagellar motility protein MotE (MotC chaperone)